MKKEELKNVLDKHLTWLCNEDDGERANLSGANLSEANLNEANLSWANLSGANLSEAYLNEANLSGANLSWANLSGAYLSGANLSRANLSGAYLSGAYLSGANLSGANLSGAYLTKSILPHFQIPQEGELIAWKAGADGRIVKLRIPPEAKRTGNLIGRKCRAEFAEVLAVYTRSGDEVTSCLGWHQRTFAYEVGKTVHPDAYDDSVLVDCGSGIHFFLTRAEAEEWGR